MDEPEPTVELTVPTAALVNAIGQLAIHHPLVLYAEIWWTLTAELAQREIGLASAYRWVQARPSAPSMSHRDQPTRDRHWR